MFWFQNNGCFSITLKNKFEIVFSPPEENAKEETHDLTKVTIVQRIKEDEPELVCEGLLAPFGALKTLELIKGLPIGFNKEELKIVFERSVVSPDTHFRKNNK